MPRFYMSHNRAIDYYETHGQDIFNLSHNGDTKTAVIFIYYLIVLTSFEIKKIVRISETQR